MNEYLQIENQFCHNKNCKFFSQKFLGNIKIHSRKEKRFRCSFCMKTWVEHKFEKHYAIKSAIKKFQEAENLSRFNLSIRQIARRVKVSPSTVVRWKEKFTY